MQLDAKFLIRRTFLCFA